MKEELRANLALPTFHHVFIVSNFIAARAAPINAAVATPKAPVTPMNLMPRKTATTRALRGIPKRFMITPLWRSGRYLRGRARDEGEGGGVWGFGRVGVGGLALLEQAGRATPSTPSHPIVPRPQRSDCWEIHSHDGLEGEEG